MCPLHLLVGNVLSSKRTTMSYADIRAILRLLVQLRIRASVASLLGRVALLGNGVDGVVFHAARGNALLSFDAFLAHFGLQVLGSLVWWIGGYYEREFGTEISNESLVVPTSTSLCKEIGFVRQTTKP